jgi:hypothetical protein
MRLGAVEVGHEVADHAGKVDRERAAALPELQRAKPVFSRRSKKAWKMSSTSCPPVRDRMQ